MSSLPSLAVVMPRGTSFGPARATSIDLCVHDFVRNSSYEARTSIHCAAVENPFTGFDLRFDYGGSGGQFAKAIRIADRIKADDSKLIVVHQHLPTAFLISKLLQRPVLFHAHNFQKLKTASLRRKLQFWRYSGLAGIIFVSEECRTHFVSNWPEVNVPTFVVHNGLDLLTWVPAPQRLKQVLVVCRAAPEKGALEAMRAIQEALPKMPGWKAKVILSEPDKHPDYFAQICNIAKDSSGAICTLLNQPHEVVKKATEESEIALVLSKWPEPFGRTAIEAHAGGAALISSGTGGLREVSGGACIFVDPNDVHAIVQALVQLGSDDDLRRKLVAAGHARMSSMFDIRKVTDDLDRVYDQCLNSSILRRS
jgi:glycosyltransferase involved in cell wall biosynthesis